MISDLQIANSKYDRDKSELIEDYLLRICSYHDSDNLTWDDVALIAKVKLGLDHSEKWYRTKWKAHIYDNISISLDGNGDEAVENLYALNERISINKQKLADERIQRNAYIRQIARLDEFKDLALEVAPTLFGTQALNLPKEVVVEPGSNEAILCISDWHFGAQEDNYCNKYNPNIAKERLAKLVNKTNEYCKLNHVKVLRICNLGDLIHGRIHSQIRIQSKMDAVTETLEVSKILVEMLTNFAKKYKVYYYDCSDNHSRIEPNKKESLSAESFSRIIKEFIKISVGSIVDVCDNVIGDDIISFETLGHKVAGIHGDQDKQNKAIANINGLTRDGMDLLLTAHLHHFSANENNYTLMLGNGSLMGTDSYAYSLRVSSPASQNLIIVSKDNVCEALYRIKL